MSDTTNTPQLPSPLSPHSPNPSPQPSILPPSEPLGGTIFYGTRGNRKARIAMVGEAWGTTEKQRELPLVGATGAETELILAECGLPPTGLAEVLQGFNPTTYPWFLTNVVSAQPSGNHMHQFFYQTGVAKSNRFVDLKGLYPKDIVRAGVATLKRQLELVNPELVIGFGNYVLWALTEKNFEIAHGTDEAAGWLVPRGVGDWRGSQLFIDIAGRQVPFLPTYHPASIFRTWPWRYLIKHDLKVRARRFLEGTLKWEAPDRNFIIRPDVTRVVQTLNWLIIQADQHAEFRAKFKLVCDLETRNGLIACIGLGWSKSDAICIPLMCVERKEGYFTIEEELLVRGLLHRLLTHKGIAIIGQNFLYDAQYLHEYDFFVADINFDTMIMHHLCWPGGGNPEKKATAAGITAKGLSNLSSLYCDHHVYWKDEGKNWAPEMGEEQLWTYNCVDCIRTYEVADELFMLIGKLGLRAQSYERMAVANELCLDMMIRGMLVDTRARAACSMELSGYVAQYDKRIEALVPEDVYPRKKKAADWVSSPKQQMEIFYDILGVKPVLSKKKRTPTVDKNSLPIIGKREPILQRIVNDIGEKRRFKHAAQACTMRLDLDGRLRSTLSPTGTETFRWSSYENAWDNGGNLQNVTKGTEDDPKAILKLPNLRKFIIPDKGHEIIEFDLSGAESQITAWEAGDEDLKAAFRAGLKVHVKNARAVYPEITKGMSDDELKATDHQGGVYYKCKRFVHGTENGGTPKGIAQMVGCPEREVQEFQDIWFTLHPGIREWQLRVERSIAETRSVSNIFGYRVVYFDRAENLAKQALAWIKQSSIAIVCTRGMLEVKRKVPWFKWLLQVHDSGVGQYPIYLRDHVKEVRKILHSVIVPYLDPLQIGWGAARSGKSWGDCKAFPEWKEWK